jgi:hypothetical protein
MGGLKAEANRVDTVSNSGGWRSVWKHVAEVSVTARTANLDSNHAVAAVGDFDKIGTL